MLSSMIARSQVWEKVAKVALGERDSVELELAALELGGLGESASCHSRQASFSANR